MAQIEGYNTFKVVGYPENFAVASKAAQNDYVLFNDPMVLIQSIYTDAGGAETFLAAAITIVYSAVATLVIGLAIKYTIGLRVSEDVEVQGIDLAEHGETAYEEAK